MSNLAEQKTAQVIEAPQQNSPARLIELAITQGANIEQLEKLLDLQERWDATQARKAFFAALTLFQSIVPAIIKRKQAHQYKYAPIGDIAEQIREPLMRCGLSYRFEQDHGEVIKVTCLVTHIDGHSEQTTMQGAPDESKSKNAIQAAGSTVSYLQRYSLTGALGITTADEDIDARLPAKPVQYITGDQVAIIEALLIEVDGKRDGFLKVCKVSDFSEMPAGNYSHAIKLLEGKRK